MNSENKLNVFDKVLESKEFNDYKHLRDNYKEILPSFKNIYKNQVQFSHVDSFDVVHNIAYLYWLEWARTEYLFEIGLPKNNSLFKVNFPLMTVNSNIDYFSSLNFPDEFKVLTKISKLGFSSIKFYNLILNANDELILKAVNTLVYVDKSKGIPLQLPQEVIEKTIAYEGY